MTRLCACGCGRDVKTPQKGSRFAAGHNQRVRPTPPANRKARRNARLMLYVMTGASQALTATRFKLSAGTVQNIVERERARWGL